MKRLIALFIALLLIVLPALAEPMSTFDYTDDILEDGSLVYYFQDLSLRLPADWRGKVMAMQNDAGVSFYQKASYEKYQAEGINGGGFLFGLSASADQSFTELPAYESLGTSDRSGLNYYLILPTDYPAYFEDAIRAEYDAMYAGIGYVAENASIYPAEAGASYAGGSTGPDAEGDILDAAPSGETAAVPWTPAQVRYSFEHSMLPRYFYDDPQNMLDAIKRVGLYTLWASISTENGVDPTYPAGDYIEHWYSADGGAALLQVELPEPDANTLCYRIYFVCDPATGSAGYYTVEHNDFLTKTSFICGWTPEREHVNYGGAAILDKGGSGYEAALRAEAEEIAKLAGVSATLIPDGDDSPEIKETASLAVISCPEQGFKTMADPAYSWDYKEGTGVSIYTESKGSIPYVIVFRSGDLIAEPFEYIREQYTPHVQKQYGEDLLSFEEQESYEIGGKRLPAGIYTYRLQGYVIHMIRLLDSTGKRTVSFSAKYIDGQGDATLEALDTAIRCFEAD